MEDLINMYCEMNTVNFIEMFIKEEYLGKLWK
jgi:hypothetical protein